MNTVAMRIGSTANAARDGGLAYGMLGAPLAFVALPLYVVLPDHYATVLGVPLAWLGAVLLGARLFDALTDPLIGRWSDRLFARSARHAWLAVAAAALVLAIGFRALFFPAVDAPAALLAWCAALLALTTLAYSVVSVIHQAWGARLGGDETRRARVVAWREGLALVGVLLASVLPALAGLGASTLLFALLLVAGVAGLARAAQPPGAVRTAAAPRLARPLATPAFRRLLAIYLVNGVASAVPATLLLFFIRDRLGAAALAPVFLACYFVAAALSVPLWVRLVARLGLARCWLAAMLLAVAVFAWAALLGEGDAWAFAAVCGLSGIALGADLTLPGALLAGVIQRNAHAGHAEGAYFGWWNFATKLNLALAAGLALPALQWFGYEPGSRSEPALSALTIAYCVLPCLLKLIAATLLTLLWIRPAAKRT